MEEIGVYVGGAGLACPLQTRPLPCLHVHHVAPTLTLRTGLLGVCGGFMPQAAPVDSLPITWVGCPGNPSPASVLSLSNLIYRKEAVLLLSLLGNCRGFGTCEPRIVDQGQIHMRKGFWSFDQMRVSYKSQYYSFPLTLGTFPESLIHFISAGV